MPHRCGLSQSAKPADGEPPYTPFSILQPVVAIWRPAALLSMAVSVCLVGCDRPDAHTASSVEQPLTVSTPDQMLNAATTAAGPSVVMSVETLAAFERMAETLDTAPPELRAAAASIMAFARDGDVASLRQVGASTVTALAQHLADRMSPDEFSELTGASLRLFPGPMATREEAVDRVLEVFDAITGNGTPASQPSALIVTDGCDRDGRVTGSVHVLPQGTSRVYAVFENNRSLAGRREVYAIWRDPANDRMVFAETEPIHPGSRYNFIWLELSEGWPAGRYSVELYDPAQPSQLLATETFLVR